MILHTEVLGDGEPIVFLHTGLQTGLTDFENQREYFKDKFKVILPDLRGHGKSVADDLTNFFEDSVEDLQETLNDLEVDSAHIVGCSLGALVGLSFAKKYNEKMKSLTISGVMSEKPKDWLELHKQSMEHQEQLMMNDEIVGYFDHLHKSDWKQSLEIAKDEEWYPFEITKDLEGISSPILYMVGEGNESETKGALYYPSIKDNVHVSIIPFASHLVHAEQSDIYTILLEKFISRCDR